MATTSIILLEKHRSDHEIEKYRLELNWTKILDKLKTAKVSGFFSSFILFKKKLILICLFFLKKNMQNFWMAEAQLELYLQQYPLTDSRHIEHARQVLIRVENLLKSVELSRSFEGQCLLSKLYYAQARYDECLTNVDLALNSIPNDIK